MIKHTVGTKHCLLTPTGLLVVVGGGVVLFCFFLVQHIGSTIHVEFIMLIKQSLIAVSFCTSQLKIPYSTF